MFAENKIVESEDSSGFGGALNLILDANVVLSGGSTQFIKNEAGYGSALSVGGSSRATWDGSMEFINNSAIIWGAVYVMDSEASWSGETEFRGNISPSGGGAIFLANGSYVGWTGETIFVSNEATADGGAL
ncbi:unnamed protein product, partial [Hapterophycus canaliculatus]